MPKRAIMVEIDLCYGYFACEVACKQEHNLPENVNWIRVHKIDSQKVNGKLQMHFYPMKCRHCTRSPCMDACPEHAITQRADGIVLISEEQCIGCSSVQRRVVSLL